MALPGRFPKGGPAISIARRPVRGVAGADGKSPYPEKMRADRRFADCGRPVADDIECDAE
jgi:hypothetical protein